MSEVEKLKQEIRELRKVVTDRLPDPIITMGYMEHFTDLVAKCVDDLAGAVDQTKLTTEQTDRLLKLQEFLDHASVDFSKAITDPSEAWKFDKGIQLKKDTRYIQKRYIPKKIELETKLNQ